MALDLNSMSLAQLVIVHNDAALKRGQQPVKSFKDKATAIARVKEMLAPKTAKAAPKEKRAGEKPTNTIGVDPDFPLAAAEKPYKIPRESGLGGKLLALLTENSKSGTTLAQMTKLVAEHDKGRDPSDVSKKVEPERRAWHQFLWLHWRCGYGLTQKDDRFFVVMPKSAAK